MSYFIDTSVILWSMENNLQISQRARDIIEDSTNEIFVRIASF